MTLCWCGAETLESPEHPAYTKCPADGTFVLRDGERLSDYGAFYTRQGYWEDHVTTLYGHPSLEAREPEMLARCSSWSQAIHKVLGKTPATLYELGSAEGTFLKTMRAQGADVLGHDVDADTAAWVREHHDIDCMSGLFPASRPMLLGPQPEPQLFEVVCGFDVLEHVPDPVEFVRAAWEHVEPGGLLVFQTPWYRDQGPKFKHFKSPEHIHLWSAPAAIALYKAAGVPLQRITNSHFAHDMLLWSLK